MASPPAANVHSRRCAPVRERMDVPLVEAIRGSCAEACPSLCGVEGALEVVLANVNPLLWRALAAVCVGGGADAATHVDATCVGHLSAYACSVPVRTCLLQTASRGEALSACLTSVSGTFGAVSEPWTERDSMFLRVLVLSLVACVVWSTILSTLFADEGAGHPATKDGR